MSHQGVATTTYGYDAFGQRVLQTGTSTTTIYPFKWYSVASSTGSGAKYSTTTSYMFNADTLLATVDQQLASGVATGTAVTSFIHPDHLGSTNIVTNASGTVVQTLDYYPYGGTRVSASVGGTNEARKYINRFADQSNLDYLNARYYDSSRGQFTTQDPVFLGNPKDQDLTNPQSLNSYSYANGNPITGKDPNGQFLTLAAATGILLAVAAILASIAYIQTSSGGHSSVGPALKAVDQILTTVGNSIQNGGSTVGRVAATTISATMLVTSPVTTSINATPIIGGTAVTTPYSITATDPLSGISNINVAQNGKTTINEKPGATVQDLQRDFEALNPTNVKDYPGGIKVGTLPNGDTVVARPNSTDGRPTLEIQRNGVPIEKTRYGTKNN
jgi:RHS repeat-associated protein